MFSNEIRKLLIEVLGSWQVLAVTVVLVIYISLVNYVARIYNSNSRKTLIPRIKSKKAKALPHSETDELELEETPK